MALNFVKSQSTAEAKYDVYNRRSCDGTRTIRDGTRTIHKGNTKMGIFIKLCTRRTHEGHANAHLPCRIVHCRLRKML